MEKIFTIRDTSGQREHLWENRQVEEEVAACRQRHIEGYFLQHLPREEKILEAGCGLGAWVIYLGERGYDIDGVDHDFNVIERLKAWQPSLRISQGDICNLPYENGSLGAYISLGVMEHFEQGCSTALAEACRVLKPGGLLFFTVPLENPFRKVFAHPLRRAYLFWQARKGKNSHFAEYRYTRREVENLLVSSGFEVFRTTWDDFNPKDMSLGLWADFPQFHSPEAYRLTMTGRILAMVLNTLSRWLLAGGVFCLARKADCKRQTITARGSQ